MTKKVVQSYTPKARGTITFDPDAYDADRGGASRASSPTRRAPRTTRSRGSRDPGGPGKTGTARGRRPGHDDIGSTSLFARTSPAGNPQYAVVAVVEQGGHGAEIAAPIVRQVIETLSNLSPPTPDPARHRRARRTDGHAHRPRRAGAAARRTRASSRTSTSRCSRCRSRSASLGLLMIYDASRHETAIGGLSRLLLRRASGRRGRDRARRDGRGRWRSTTARIRDAWPLVYLARAAAARGRRRARPQPRRRAGVVPGRAVPVPAVGDRQGRAGGRDRRLLPSASRRPRRVAASRSRSGSPGSSMAIVYAQHDLGTMLVIMVCAAAVLVIAGLKPRAHRRAAAARGVARRCGRGHGQGADATSSTG